MFISFSNVNLSGPGSQSMIPHAAMDSIETDEVTASCLRVKCGHYSANDEMCILVSLV